MKEENSTPSACDTNKTYILSAVIIFLLIFFFSALQLKEINEQLSKLEKRFDKPIIVEALRGPCLPPKVLKPDGSCVSR